MNSLTVSAAQTHWSAEDMHRLNKLLASSGTVLTCNENGPTADVASTGGPASLSTLLCPLYLRSYGFVVPKLGVPGRPAGGIDVLAQLPGYRVDLSEADVRRVLERCGYAHFLAGTQFAP